jgi:hypothetical protein
MLRTILLLTQVTSGLAADGVGPFDGKWTGSATPAVQKCEQGNVTVTVDGTTGIGQAQFANDAPNINGTVGWQPLTGKFVADGFEGTFKNGDCEWKMSHVRIGRNSYATVEGYDGWGLEQTRQMLGLIRELLQILSVIVISFACGYAFRDWKSRRRRDAQRKKFHQRHPTSTQNTGFMKI